MRSIITSRVEPFGSSMTSRSCGRTNVAPDPVRLTDERHHELVGRLLVHVPRRADLLDVPLAHDDDLVGDLHRLLLVVRDDHRRRVRLVVEAAEPFAELGPHLRVQRPEGLVEEKHGRIDRERTGQPHPLPLPAGELGGIALRETLELDELQELVDPLLDLGLGPLPDLQAERHVVVHGHVLEGGVVLEDEADAAFLRRAAGDVLVVDEDGALVGRLEPGDDPQQRGLAAAARTEERRQRSGPDLHGDVVERDEVVEALRDAPDRDRHQYRDSFGWRKIMARRMMTAVAARTKAMP